MMDCMLADANSDGERVPERHGPCLPPVQQTQQRSRGVIASDRQSRDPYSATRWWISGGQESTN